MSEKDYPNERDCEHGHLRRSCPTCAAEADYAALLTRHNALEARIKQINVWAECDKCACLFIPGGKGLETTCATCIKEERDVLVEAVTWIKECELVRHYVIFDALETCALREITGSISAARAEVDRLIGRGEMSTAQKCERCREYNAAAVDFRNQAANAQADLVALLTRHNTLVEAK